MHHAARVYSILHTVHFIHRTIQVSLLENTLYTVHYTILSINNAIHSIHTSLYTGRRSSGFRDCKYPLTVMQQWCRHSVSLSIYPDTMSTPRTSTTYQCLHVTDCGGVNSTQLYRHSRHDDITLLPALGLNLLFRSGQGCIAVKSRVLVDPPGLPAVCQSDSSHLVAVARCSECFTLLINSTWVFRCWTLNTCTPKFIAKT